MLRYEKLIMLLYPVDASVEHVWGILNESFLSHHHKCGLFIVSDLEKVFVVTFKPAEWNFPHIFVILQFWVFLVKLGAGEWVITSEKYIMLLQLASFWAFVVTLGEAEWVFTSKKYFMLLQKAWYLTFVVTLRAAEWVITSEKYFMLFQKDSF